MLTPEMQICGCYLPAKLARNIPNSLKIEVQLKFNPAFTMPTYTKKRARRVAYCAQINKH